MKTIIILSLFILSFEAKNVTKRNLASQFSSNPFFLQHFRHENEVTAERNWEEPDEYHNYYDYEEPGTISNPKKEPSFNVLPLFQRNEIFQNLQDNIDLNPVEMVSQTQSKLVTTEPVVHFVDVSPNVSNGNEPVRYYFKVLPFYEANKKFQVEPSDKLVHVEPQNEPEQKPNVDDFVLVQKSEIKNEPERLKLTPKNEPQITNVKNQNQYSFKLLPGFERSQKFQAGEPKLLVGNEPQITQDSVNWLPVFEYNYNFKNVPQVRKLAIKNEPQIIEPLSTESQHSNQYFFKSLPVFDRTLEFHTVGDVPLVQKTINENELSTGQVVENVPRIQPVKTIETAKNEPQFSTVVKIEPHLQEFTVKNEPVTTELEDPHQYFFKSLPVFEQVQNSITENEPSKSGPPDVNVQNQTQYSFKLLPGYEKSQLFQEVHNVPLVQTFAIKNEPFSRVAVLSENVKNVPKTTKNEAFVQEFTMENEPQFHNVPQSAVTQNPAQHFFKLLPHYGSDKKFQDINNVPLAHKFPIGIEPVIITPLVRENVKNESHVLTIVKNESQVQKFTVRNEPQHQTAGFENEPHTTEVQNSWQYIFNLLPVYERREKFQSVGNVPQLQKVLITNEPENIGEISIGNVKNLLQVSTTVKDEPLARKFIIKNEPQTIEVQNSQYSSNLLPVYERSQKFQSIGNVPRVQNVLIINEPVSTAELSIENVKNSPRVSTTVKNEPLIQNINKSQLQTTVVKNEPQTMEVQNSSQFNLLPVYERREKFQSVDNVPRVQKFSVKREPVSTMTLSNENVSQVHTQIESEPLVQKFISKNEPQSAEVQNSQYSFKLLPVYERSQKFQSVDYVPQVQNVSINNEPGTTGVTSIENVKNSQVPTTVRNEPLVQNKIVKNEPQLQTIGLKQEPKTTEVQNSSQYSFNLLPLYERKEKFQSLENVPQVQKVTITNEPLNVTVSSVENMKNVPRVQTFERGPVVQKASVNNEPLQKGKPIQYSFRALPLFDRTVKFLEIKHEPPATVTNKQPHQWFKEIPFIKKNRNEPSINGTENVSGLRNEPHSAIEIVTTAIPQEWFKSLEKRIQNEPVIGNEKISSGGNVPHSGIRVVTTKQPQRRFKEVPVNQKNEPVIFQNKPHSEKISLIKKDNGNFGRIKNEPHFENMTQIKKHKTARNEPFDIGNGSFSKIKPHSGIEPLTFEPKNVTKIKNEPHSFVTTMQPRRRFKEKLVKNEPILIESRNSSKIKNEPHPGKTPSPRRPFKSIPSIDKIEPNPATSYVYHKSIVRNRLNPGYNIFPHFDINQPISVSEIRDRGKLGSKQRQLIRVIKRRKPGTIAELPLDHSNDAVRNSFV